jgi:hypothetical protein
LGIQQQEETKLIELILLLYQKGIKPAITAWGEWIQSPYSLSALRTAAHLCDIALRKNKTSLLLPFFNYFSDLPQEQRLRLDAYHIWALLLANKWKAAHDLLETYPLEQRQQETSALYPLMGCWVCHEKGKEAAKAYFSGGFDLLYPPVTALLSGYLFQRIDIKKGWLSQAFFWEKVQLFRQLQLFYHCAQQPQQAKIFYQRMKQEYQRVQINYAYP